MLYFSRWKTIGIWLAVVAGLLFSLPNLFPKETLARLPDWLPKRQMTLGLDLQGGSQILLKLERKDIEKDRLEATRDEIRRLLRDESIGYTGLSGANRVVQVRIRDQNQVTLAKETLKPLTDPVSAGAFSGGSITEAILSEPEPGLLVFTLTDEGLDFRTSAAVSQSVEVIGRRVNELGTTEPIIQRQGADRILIQVPGLDDPQRLKDLLGRTAKLTFQMVDQSMPASEALQTHAPAGSRIMYSNDDPPVPYLIEDRVIVSGEDLVDAQATYDQRTQEPVVSFRFDTKGAARFGQATQQNVGRLFAIILDNAVISAPRINEPILGGSGQISGNFTAGTANDLAVLLRAGALPATLTVIEERTVGPSLGRDSIEAGKLAGIVGAVLVVVFMIGAYGRLGVYANIALAANVTLLVALLSLFGATLTLPGIAGIVLTVGMAVDSNVLIYERIREERRGGRSVIQSIDTGFTKALATIVDANLTTLIAAGVLFWFGTGPVRGFAVTLAIGIATTVFSAFFFTLWLVAHWVRTSKPKELPRGFFSLVPEVTRIPFMGIRRMTFTFSALASIAAIVLFMTVNMNYGIDFKGGTLIEVQARQGAADVGDLRSRLSDLNLGDVQVQGFGDPAEALIRVEAQGGGDNAEQTVVTKVQGELAQDYEFRRVEVVGPTVSAELARAGTIGVLISLVAILLYIWVRFEWHFALGAIIATVHDVVMTIGFFVITGIEFNSSSIAAILTIVGYSLNDTVVVYDRVRENLRRYKKMPLPQLLDLSMNETLARTTMTSLTTLLALIALFAFGGEVIRSFTAAMIFGVVIGTYSSIFIAAPVLILFKLRSSSMTANASESETGAADKAPAA